MASTAYKRRGGPVAASGQPAKPDYHAKRWHDSPSHLGSLGPFLVGVCSGLLICAVMVKVAPPVVTVAAPVRAKYVLSADSIAFCRGGHWTIWKEHDDKRQLSLVKAVEFSRVTAEGGAELSAR